jgi:hypothetical protein
MFQIKVVEKIKTHILRLVFLFFRKSWLFYDDVKYGAAREVADENMAAH